MSLEKGILSGAEHRKNSKHCLCKKCVFNRLYKNIKRIQSIEYKFNQYNLNRAYD